MLIKSQILNYIEDLKTDLVNVHHFINTLTKANFK